MKRLMVALAAVASAFGLYATDPITSTSFEGASEFDEGGNLITGSAWTASADPDAKLTQGAYAGDDYVYTTDNERYEVFGSDQASYLSIKTALGTGSLTRNFGEKAADGIYADMNVKFTAFDEKPTIGANDKLALFVRDMTEDATAPTPRFRTTPRLRSG